MARRRRRRTRAPKAVDKLMVAGIAAGLTWLVLTSHYLHCPHTPALVISCVAGGIVIGLYLNKPTIRWQVGPVKVSVGTGRGAVKGSAGSRECRYSQCDRPVSTSPSGGSRSYCGPPERVWPGGKTCRQLAAAERAAARASQQSTGRRP